MRRSTFVARSCAAVIALGAMACLGTTTDTTRAQVSVAGTWTFTSTDVAHGTSLLGTLTLSQDSTVRFNGTLDANETDPRGLVRHVVAIVSGRTIDATLADFDMVIGAAVTRQHNATIKGDSLTGTWVEVSDAGISASGTFRAHRVHQ